MRFETAETQTSSADSPRIFVKDKSSKLTFLIDSGSDVSIIPCSYVKNPEIKIRYSLAAANGATIKTTGMQDVSLDLGFTDGVIRWIFIVADVKSPILGADLLKFHHLIPDLTRR
jgi:cleavage and polyadenylation specificity factor subunit 1